MEDGSWELEVGSWEFVHHSKKSLKKIYEKQRIVK